jgi:hypothetical protein
LVAFFIAFEMFTTGIAQEAESLAQYLMLLATLVLAVVGAYFFRKKEKKRKTRRS